ncbi:MAG: histidine kinase [Acidobacteria bacterium]|nr:histidine kinase [Acidobacteriota bacterium]
MKPMLFGAIGLLLGAIVATFLGLRGGAPWQEAMLLGLPLGFVQAALCLAARFPARAARLAPGNAIRIAATHLSAAVVSTGGWILAGFGLARILERIPAYAGAFVRFQQEAAPLAVTGVLIFLLAVTAHYLIIALESAREAEVRELSARMLAREAELRALRAQVDPHFLFNCLNSIATLTAEDPGRARRMCLQLAGFLRQSLALGQQDHIQLGEELALAGEYLAIESIRFGPRLHFAQSVEDGCFDCPVPPLLLQPVVENAVRHGIAQILEGGTIRIHAHRGSGGIIVTVENPRDPERPAGRGTGVGLENVRGRLRALHGERAGVEMTATATLVRVRLFIPWVGEASDAGAEPRTIGKESDGAL